MGVNPIEGKGQGRDKGMPLGSRSCQGKGKGDWCLAGWGTEQVMSSITDGYRRW